MSTLDTQRDADNALTQHQSSDLDRHIEAQIAMTDRVDRGSVVLIAHRVNCRLKSPRTPLAMMNPNLLAGTALKPCTTCQPSQQQQHDLRTYVDARAAAYRRIEQTRADACLDDARYDERDNRHIDDKSAQQRKLIELRASAAKVSELDAALIKLGVDPHAPVADVVPLVKRGKRNDKSRTRKHEQRDVQPRTPEQQQLADATRQLESTQTRECVDCKQQIKLTAFPTSTLKGQRVRLDYCRKCRTVRAAAKASKS